MEDVAWIEIVVGILAVALPMGFIYLRKFVKSTETTVDDKILAAVTKAFNETAKDSEAK